MVYKFINYLKSKQFLDNKKNLSKKTVEIFAFRDRYKNGVRNIEHSLIFDINLMTDVTQATSITTVGWERNEKNNLIPKIVNYFYIYLEMMILLIFNLIKKVDMSSTMNTERLAESAVSLNLKLMKWRIAPNINLEIVKNKKCLLLGSGTLGCNVARTLLAWGVDTITFVDNSKVSFSRQYIWSIQR